MITIKRPNRPILFDSTLVVEEVKRQELFYYEDPKLREESKFKPLFKINRKLREILASSFNHKCAFCESLLIDKYSVVERFRPSIKAMDLKGKISEEHYWWLRYEWDNLFPICSECNKNKSNLFPIKGKRSLPGTTGDDLNKEIPLLINPCFDIPEKHFFYDFNSGLMISNTERGRITIDVYGLNRHSLIEQRKIEIQKFTGKVNHFILNLKQLNKSSNINDLDSYLKLEEEELFNMFKMNTYPYLLLKRQYILKTLNSNLDLMDKLTFKVEWEKLLTSYPVIQDKQQQNALIKYKDYLVKGDDYNLNNKTKLDLYFRKSLYIEKIEIKILRLLKV